MGIGAGVGTSRKRTRGSIRTSGKSISAARQRGIQSHMSSYNQSLRHQSSGPVRKDVIGDNSLVSRLGTGNLSLGSLGRNDRQTGGGSWSSGVRRIDGGPGGGPGGHTGTGADGTAGDSGKPVFMDKAAMMDKSLANTQQHVDNAKAGATARRAEMGLDSDFDQAAAIAGAGQLAGASQQAGFMADEYNVGMKNQFTMAEMQNDNQNERFYASLSNQQAQNQQQSQLQQQQYYDQRQDIKFGRDAAAASAQESAKTAGLYWNPNRNSFSDVTQSRAYRSRNGAQGGHSRYLSIL